MSKGWTQSPKRNARVFIEVSWSQSQFRWFDHRWVIESDSEIGLKFWNHVFLILRFTFFTCFDILFKKDIWRFNPTKIQDMFNKKWPDSNKKTVIFTVWKNRFHQIITKEVWFQEISNRTHWTDPSCRVSNSSSNLLRGPLLRSHLVFDGLIHPRVIASNGQSHKTFGPKISVV